MEKLIERINELANKSKVEELSDEEKEEQANLRKEYIEIFRGNMEEAILNTKLVDEDGNDITPDKVKREQNKRKFMN